jgi:hypothetical protein
MFLTISEPTGFATTSNTSSSHSAPSAIPGTHVPNSLGHPPNPISSDPLRPRFSVPRPSPGTTRSLATCSAPNPGCRLVSLASTRLTSGHSHLCRTLAACGARLPAPPNSTLPHSRHPLPRASPRITLTQLPATRLCLGTRIGLPIPSLFT